MSTVISLPHNLSLNTKETEKNGKERGTEYTNSKGSPGQSWLFFYLFIFTYKQKCHNNKPKQSLSLLLRSQCGLAGRVIYKPAGD